VPPRRTGIGGGALLALGILIGAIGSAAGGYVATRSTAPVDPAGAAIATVRPVTVIPAPASDAIVDVVNELLPTVGPGIAPDNPREAGHLAIDLGADLVIGNHPHWVEPVEIYKDRLIAYAHGNFIFDQMWSQETREGVVGRYTFYGTKLIRVDYRPLVIDDYAQPRWLDEGVGEGKAIIDRMTKASEQLATG